MESTDLGALVTLDALLQESSVSGAARRLGLSTPAVSHALARLRERLGDDLLVRAGRGMVLTPRAESLRPRVRDAVAAAARVFEAPATFDPRTLSRAFTLSMTDYVLAVFGAPFEQAVRDAAPGLDLRVIPNALDDDARLRDGVTDLAVGIYGPLPPELKTLPIISERLVCVLRDDHPVVRRRLTLAQYTALEHVQVAPRGRPGGYIDELLAARGLSRRVARAVPYFQIALEMTARSDYILTISERLARRDAARLGLRVLAPPLPLEPFALSMVWHPRFDGDRAHRWLRETLLATTRAQGGLAHPEPRRRLGPTDPTTGRARRRRRKA
ncbi:MAG: LysR family transcriptional regulator [Myxococcales bacterium]|nr:LysR family transcriptional regulator [Myxococcales bacterium]MCB9754229.1 LysR family transcriptional regulator [Myxococcales bacterium]